MAPRLDNRKNAENIGSTGAVDSLDTLLIRYCLCNVCSCRLDWRTLPPIIQPNDSHGDPQLGTVSLNRSQSIAPLIDQLPSNTKASICAKSQPLEISTTSNVPFLQSSSLILPIYCSTVIFALVLISGSSSSSPPSPPSSTSQTLSPRMATASLRPQFSTTS